MTDWQNLRCVERLDELTKAIDTLQREDQMRRDAALIDSADRAQVTNVQQRLRDIDAEVRGILAREVPGHDAEVKLGQSNLVVELDDALRRAEAEIAALQADVAALKHARAVGDGHA